MRLAPDVDLVATREGDRVAVLVWNYHDDDVPEEGGVTVDLDVAGLSAERMVQRHFRVDGRHSNAFAAWRRAGSPQQPSDTIYRELEAASRPALLAPPAEAAVADGVLRLSFPLERHAVSLIELTPASGAAISAPVRP